MARSIVRSSRIVAPNSFDAETMRRLWIVGLAMIVASFAGLAVSSPLASGSIPDGPAGWWGQMSEHHIWMHGYGDAGDVTAPIPGASPVEVRAFDFGFEPASLAVTGPVNLTLTNEGSVVHDLTIPSLGIRIIAGPGQQAIGGVEAAPGTYEFVCSIPGHARAGMTGTLEVGR